MYHLSFYPPESRDLVEYKGQSICAYMWISIHIHNSFICQLKGPESNDTLVARSTPGAKIIILAKIIKNPDLLEK